MCYSLAERCGVEGREGSGVERRERDWEEGTSARLDEDAEAVSSRSLSSAVLFNSASS